MTNPNVIRIVDQAIASADVRGDVVVIPVSLWTELLTTLGYFQRVISPEEGEELTQGWM